MRKSNRSVACGEAPCAQACSSVAETDRSGVEVGSDDFLSNDWWLVRLAQFLVARLGRLLQLDQRPPCATFAAVRQLGYIFFGPVCEVEALRRCLGIYHEEPFGLGGSFYSIVACYECVSRLLDSEPMPSKWSAAMPCQSFADGAPMTPSSPPKNVSRSL